MVRHILIAIFLLTGLPHAAVGQDRLAAFNVAVSSTRVEYGKSVFLVLHASRSTPRLDTLDLSPLETDFAIERRDDVEHDTGATTQRWRIRIYPRHPGELIIPPLAFHGKRTEPVPIRVTPAIDHKDDTPIAISTHVSQTNVWLKQPVRIDMQIETGASIVVFDSDNPKNSNIEFMPLAVTRQTVTHKGQKRTRHKLGWVLYPLSPGAHSLQLPPIRYQRDGVITHRFFPPRLDLVVKPLPAYVPATMPVGKFDVRVTLPERAFQISNRLGYLSLHTVSNGLPGQYLPGLLRQFKSNRAVKFYPPQVETTGNAPGYRIPFVINHMGLVSLPTLRLQYFDPDTGKLHTRRYAIGRLLVMSQWLMYSIYMLLVLALFLILRLAARKLRTLLHYNTQYRLAARELQHAGQPDEFRSALIHIAQAEHWPANLSLQRWLQCWQSRYPGMTFINDKVLRLQAWCYGGCPADVRELRNTLLKICYRRAPLLRLFS